MRSVGDRVLAGMAYGLAALVSGCSARDNPRISEEARRREEYARALLLDAGAAAAVRVGSSNDVHFEEGFSIVQFDPPDDFRSHAFRWLGPKGHVRLRTHGEKPMRLKLGGWVNEKVIKARPRITAYIDGQNVGGTGAIDEKGLFGIESVVQPSVFRGKRWVDLHLVVNAVAFHWADPPDLKVALIIDFQWTE